MVNSTQIRTELQQGENFDTVAAIKQVMRFFQKYHNLATKQITSLSGAMDANCYLS